MKRIVPLLFGMLRWTAFSFVPRSRLSRTLSSLPYSNVETEESAPPRHHKPFEITSQFEPTGDQPQAIHQVCQNLQRSKYAILQGATGTGKTFVMSHVIKHRNVPTLVLCHNKTLAAQLARELKSMLSKNAVELFVSYYNHYIPESYKESTDTYIEKKSSINSNIDALRHFATRSLVTRPDVVVVASVSCIFGHGLPSDYMEHATQINVGDWNDDWGSVFLGMWYEPTTDEFDRGQFQLHGDDTILVWPSQELQPISIHLKNKRVVSILQQSTELPGIHIFPAKHHVVGDDRMQTAIRNIEDELTDRVAELRQNKQFPESDRLLQRVSNDLAMMKETGFCKGIENYSRHLAGRAPGSTPGTLLDYMKFFKDDWLLLIDESHVTIPQLQAMYHGDRKRKLNLVKHGFRLPSALDNRPLNEQEFWEQVPKAVFVSATPGNREMIKADDAPVEMIIRPTFVPDPIIEVRPRQNQLNDFVQEVEKRVKYGQRTLALAFTKRDAEDLSSYLKEKGVSSDFIHSGMNTQARSDVLKKLQTGNIDCLVGVNLLREGLDLPQVSLVAVFRADSEGFLRSDTALLQGVGRAARNVYGKAILYADRVTPSMKRCMDETRRRREIQLAYNDLHDCDARSTKGSSMKSIFDIAKEQIEAYDEVKEKFLRENESTGSYVVPSQLELKLKTGSEVKTDHIPSSPGCYFWKDAEGEILYVGKAAKLRNRVKSYLSPKANHGKRIQVMIEKAASVDFILTPSERDALVLESNLIKHHRPKFNVLMKDDQHYPYICAASTDPFPRLFAAWRKNEEDLERGYQYFGPYTSAKEINAVLEDVEQTYQLRSKSFLAREGSLSKKEYQQQFAVMMKEVFGKKSDAPSKSLLKAREEFEEAGLLFDSEYNTCVDVVAASTLEADNSVLVLVCQLRDGVVAGFYQYGCYLPDVGLSSDEDIAEAINTILVGDHYPLIEHAKTTGQFSWIPDEVLLSHTPPQGDKDLKDVIRRCRKNENKNHPERKHKRPPLVIRLARKKGPKAKRDARALEFAVANANQLALDTIHSESKVHSTAASTELSDLIRLPSRPTRIECFVSFISFVFVRALLSWHFSNPTIRPFRILAIRKEIAQWRAESFFSMVSPLNTCIASTM